MKSIIRNINLVPLGKQKIEMGKKKYAYIKQNRGRI